MKPPFIVPHKDALIPDPAIVRHSAFCSRFKHYQYITIFHNRYNPLTVVVDLPAIRIALLNWDKRDA